MPPPSPLRALSLSPRISQAIHCPLAAHSDCAGYALWLLTAPPSSLPHPPCPILPFLHPCLPPSSLPHPFLLQAVADDVIIQYGGSVNDANVDDLMGCADIDGALVGGASLKAVSD